MAVLLVIRTADPTAQIHTQMNGGFELNMEVFVGVERKDHVIGALNV